LPENITLHFKKQFVQKNTINMYVELNWFSTMYVFFKHTLLKVKYLYTKKINMP